MRIFVFVATIASLLPCFLYSYPHITSYPYLSGGTFRSIANFIFDEEEQMRDPSRVKRGDIIFVKTDYLDHFFSHLHPHIKYPYILISHNSDYSAPGAFMHYLDDDRLIAWFGQNPDAEHPKFHPIPIGLANQYWPHGKIDVVDKARANVPAKPHASGKLAYMNFSPGTHASRKAVYDAFCTQPFCYVAGQRSFLDYLTELARFAFTISPRGNGLDCHRHWEALLMGCIPIVQHSLLDPLFEDLPVLLINNWSEVTDAFLREQAEKMAYKKYRHEKMFADYWLTLIKNVQKKAQNIQDERRK